VFGRVDLYLVGAGMLVSVLGAALVDLWLIGVSLRALLRRDGIWGVIGLVLGLLILGGIVAFAWLLAPVFVDLQG